MHKKEFEVIEVDGVVVYDESNDYVPGEDFYDELCKLEGNDDLDMEYILSTESLREAEMRRKKRRDGLVSVAVITSIVLYVGVLCWLFF
ncbi:MAG: hypothetical protein K2I64_03390 [Muribaculaceae bacterium]|nr:hypothetical protein [Muribaculaceae bacterium]